MKPPSLRRPRLRSAHPPNRFPVCAKPAPVAQGANGVWIVNVGDLKNTERSTEFFLDLAWHAVARVKIGDKLVMDDFYNGLPLEIGLKRYAAEIQQAGGLTIEILPLRADAPIYMPGRPAAGSPPMLSLDAVNIAPVYQSELR